MGGRSHRNQPSLSLANGDERNGRRFILPPILFVIQSERKTQEK
jgi:hypothetical protein